MGGTICARFPPPFTHLAVTKTERRMDSRAFGNIRRQLSLWSRRWVGTRVPLGPNGGVLLGVSFARARANHHHTVTHGKTLICHILFGSCA